MSLSVLVEGFLVSFGLIVAIGPQNAYVLRQGLKRRFVAQVATVCFLSDFTLITLGVMGVGRFVAENGLLSQIVGWGGVVFLTWFALHTLSNALRPGVIDSATMEAAAGPARGGGRRTVLLHALAFTWLNPHVYLDTLVLIGGVSVKFTQDMDRLAFVAGAGAASALWFYGLAFGAARAAPLFRRRIVWRLLDLFIFMIMAGVAIALARHQLGY